MYEGMKNCMIILKVKKYINLDHGKRSEHWTKSVDKPQKIINKIKYEIL